MADIEFGEVTVMVRGCDFPLIVDSAGFVACRSVNGRMNIATNHAAKDVQQSLVHNTRLCQRYVHAVHAMSCITAQQARTKGQQRFT